MSLRLPDSGVTPAETGRRNAPSAERNAAPILAVLSTILQPGMKVLELASGTGQHAAQFNAAHPGLLWQATDGDPENLKSIRAWMQGLNQPEPQVLNACIAGWGYKLSGQDLILVVNLLHLISDDEADCMIAEAVQALNPEGRFCIYGPFLRNGHATSPGDQAFDASLRAQDQRIGYKDLNAVTDKLLKAGMRVKVIDMPANNVMLVGAVCLNELSPT